MSMLRVYVYTRVQVLTYLSLSLYIYIYTYGHPLPPMIDASLLADCSATIFRLYLLSPK